MNTQRLHSIADSLGMSSGLAAVLAPYAKTADVTAAVETAVAPILLDVATDGDVATVLVPYAKTADVETLVGTTAATLTTAIAAKATPADIATALTPYATTAAVAAATAGMATTGYVTAATTNMATTGYVTATVTAATTAMATTGYVTAAVTAATTDMATNTGLAAALVPYARNSAVNAALLNYPHTTTMTAAITAATTDMATNTGVAASLVPYAKSADVTTTANAAITTANAHADSAVAAAAVTMHADVATELVPYAKTTAVTAAVAGATADMATHAWVTSVLPTVTLQAAYDNGEHLIVNGDGQGLLYWADVDPPPVGEEDGADGLCIGSNLTIAGYQTGVNSNINILCRPDHETCAKVRWQQQPEGVPEVLAGMGIGDGLYGAYDWRLTHNDGVNETTVLAIDSVGAAHCDQAPFVDGDYSSPDGAQLATGGYVNAQINAAASTFATNASVAAAIAPLATSASVTAALAPYAQTSALSGYATTGALTAATTNMATTGYVTAATTAMATTGYVTSAVTNMATTGYVTSSLASYAGAHNSTTGLQGGTTGQYYHLTAAKNAELVGGTLTGISSLMTAAVADANNYYIKLYPTTLIDTGGLVSMRPTGAGTALNAGAVSISAAYGGNPATEPFRFYSAAFTKDIVLQKGFNLQCHVNHFLSGTGVATNWVLYDYNGSTYTALVGNVDDALSGQNYWVTKQLTAKAYSFAPSTYTITVGHQLVLVYFFKGTGGVQIAANDSNTEAQIPSYVQLPVKSPAPGATLSYSDGSSWNLSYDFTDTGITAVFGAGGKLMGMPSSRRWKDAEHEVDDDDELKLGALVRKQWTWKATDRLDPRMHGKTQTGFIAEDVAGVNPDWVVMGEDGTPAALNYPHMVESLISVVAKLQRRVHQLERKE